MRFEPAGCEIHISERSRIARLRRLTKSIAATRMPFAARARSMTVLFKRSPFRQAAVRSHGGNLLPRSHALQDKKDRSGKWACFDCYSDSPRRLRAGVARGKALARLNSMLAGPCLTTEIIFSISEFICFPCSQIGKRPFTIFW